MLMDNGINYTFCDLSDYLHGLLLFTYKKNKSIPAFFYNMTKYNNLTWWCIVETKDFHNFLNN